MQGCASMSSTAAVADSAHYGNQCSGPLVESNPGAGLGGAAPDFGSRDPDGLRNYALTARFPGPKSVRASAAPPCLFDNPDVVRSSLLHRLANVEGVTISQSACRPPTEDSRRPFRQSRDYFISLKKKGRNPEEAETELEKARFKFYPKYSTSNLLV